MKIEELELVQPLATKTDLQASDIEKRIEQLTEFINLCDGRANPFELAQAGRDLERVRQRMALGAEFTVAALVGGTGSGKSTLFNALTGFDFADAGELRPTTERATACTWRANADDLLDYLEIDLDRRIEHDSILTPVPNELAGLVLLDLPDHDSVQQANSVTVGRLMPLIDVLIWVVDPQKYADQLLHREYLEALRTRARSMFVVMNHADTVLESQLPVLLDDLRRLLVQDGLGEVPVFPISALHRQGLDPVKEILSTVAKGASTTVHTAAAELDAITARLGGEVSLIEAELDRADLAPIAESIARASGVPAVVAAISESGSGVTKTALSRPEQPALTMVNAIRDDWVNTICAALLPAWKKEVEAAVAPADKLRRRVGNIYSSIALPGFSRGGFFFAISLSVVLFALAVAVIGGALENLFGSLVASLFGGTAGVSSLLVTADGVAGILARIIVASILALIAVVVYLVAANRQRQRAKNLAEKYSQEVHEQLLLVLDELWLQNASIELARHRKARMLLVS
ncbi:MAG: GTPase [Arcanobacterium sp.]|nr:GTPase [Arcanobacterium sp.]